MTYSRQAPMSAGPGREGADWQHDVETPDTVRRRFGIEILDVNLPKETAVLSMPITGLRNPFTDTPTVGPLAILVDAACGLVNHLRRPLHRWTVSSELSVELSPDSVHDSDLPVVASARTLGPVASSSLSSCTLTHGESVIGGGTVRSFYIPGSTLDACRPPDTLVKTAQTTLADLMAVQVRAFDEGVRMLSQGVDPMLNNEIGIVHGGVAAAGLELVASAAINPLRSRDPLRTASIRVNFLRPFIASAHSRYVGAPLRIGRSTAVGDSQALGEDGKVTIAARVTAYR
jgi:uncharacterized protein (TIGR00369 family)